MSPSCANKKCELPPLTASDARIEIKAVLPAGFSSTDDFMCVNWKPNGEAAFHVCCWKSVLKMARTRRCKSRQRKPTASEVSDQAPVMRQAEKLMVVEAAKTAETFDSEEDIKKAAKETATLIQNARHCIAFTGAGISTSAGLGDYRGKSGKWTEQDSSQKGGAINEAFQQDLYAATSSSCAHLPLKSPRSENTSERHIHTLRKIVGSTSTSDQADDMAPPVKRLKVEDIKDEVAPETDDQAVEADEEETEETVDYENLRPTYTHEALVLLAQQRLLHFVISQNCDGLHLLSGLPAEHISELHGNVFMERCPTCETRYSRNFYVMSDEASQYYEELEDFGKTDLIKPRFAVQCKLCGLCHRTGRRCEEKGCRGFLEDTIINFRDNLEESILDRAFDEASLSDLVLCLGTTLTVTPACDIVEEAKGQKPLVICNRQKTEKDSMAKIRVFGDCDVFMREVLGHLIGEEDRSSWEARREERMKEYNAQREMIPPKKQ